MCAVEVEAYAIVHNFQSKSWYSRKKGVGRASSSFPANRLATLSFKKTARQSGKFEDINSHCMGVSS